MSAASFSRRTFVGTTGMVALALLGGCSGASGSSSSSAGAASADKKTLVVGTLATEDILPLWVAQTENLFEGSGATIDVVTFQSATELIAGVSSGAVDLAMTDIMVTASMFAGGTDVQMKWVTLGATPDQGRFGIMVGPKSQVTSLNDLAGVPIGVGSNTILEYVMDKLMLAAGVSPDGIVVEELQKLPVRYQAMASGDVAAAALPGTLLALGETNGCKLVADDTQGENLSQSVMIVRSTVLADDARAKQVQVIQDVWDKAADMVNANPEKYRTVLVQNANLPQEIAATYPISTYPKAALPTSAMVDPVLDWMKQKGYLTKALTYNASTGEFSA